MTCGKRSREDSPAPAGQDRRQFLRVLCGGAAAVVGSPQVFAESPGTTSAGPGASNAQPLPTIKLGNAVVSRLVAGGNPATGNSHSTRNLSRHMREYFTPEVTADYFRRCHAQGINTFQSSPSDKIRDALNAVRQQGCPMQWIPISSARPLHDSIKKLLELKPVAIVHHGSVTDTLFQTNQIDKVHDYVKQVHDAGLPAGISTHEPRVVAYVEEKGWENDFFMTCLYNVMRRPEEIRERLGTVPLGEPFLEDDPLKMTAVIKQTKKPCLAFKLLAAGRLCWSPEQIEQAFKFAFSNIKKTDGVIVGMYPRFTDEISENAWLALKFCGLSIL